ncbi:2-amino-4-hydroxy-6-hydroxymethyldihydropteridine diphosphokinase [Ningiella sp. W23]|uniref:2-amino-4-hydroxy-6- hydroxymethyldihydropteridine diphosphokinase n=1 Tax=Ningiella sp. W23 TaxID=3023715 RepID=UPI0037569D52
MTTESHCILISLGSNVDKEHNTKQGLDAMQKAFGALEVSSVYESQAVGFDGENFFNLVVKAFTSLSIEAVCTQLKSIEAKCGRKRSAVKFSPRTLDLDLLTYDKVVCDKPITLPREEICYNAFVLQPMAELIPNETHPVTGKCYQTMWQEYDKNKQRLWPTPFAWSAN